MARGSRPRDADNAALMLSTRSSRPRSAHRGMRALSSGDNLGPSPTRRPPVIRRPHALRRWMARPPDAGRMSDMAEDLDATMSQLRASVRLCRLWRDRDRPGEVSRPRRALSETFTEALRQLISWKPAAFWTAASSRPRQGGGQSQLRRGRPCRRGGWSRQ
jgi:hypothetical protein